MMTTSIVVMAKHLRVATGNAEHSDAFLAGLEQREAERDARDAQQKAERDAREVQQNAARDAREAQQNAARDAREERHRKEQERLAAVLQKEMDLQHKEIKLLRWVVIVAAAILGLSYTVTSAFLTFTITSAF